MLTNDERVRAFIGNIKHYNWELFPDYRMTREEAQAICERLTTTNAAGSKAEPATVATT